MTKKHQKLIYAAILILLFLGYPLSYHSFLHFAENRVFAAALEVQYPTVSGQSLTAQSKLPAFVLYLFNFGMLLGFFAVFISLTIAGVMFFLSPVNVELRASARERVSGAISGLLILVLTYLIITTINPQLSILNLNELPPAPQPPAEKKYPGVYLYKTGGCSDNSVEPRTSSIPNLDDLKNKVNSVGIVRDPDTGTAYFSILYESINLWGKCQQLDPNQECQSTTPFASSISIHTYDFDPNGDGVYFYRKSYFNKNGGYVKISNSDIGEQFVADLNLLCFLGENSDPSACGNIGDCTVPEEEQNCVKYDNYGNCISRSCPTLGGENISSIEIKGSYFVLLVYVGSKDPAYGPWTSCQEFPTPSDINKTGPQQIKWQNIRNNGGVIPNYVVIVPIKS